MNSSRWSVIFGLFFIACAISLPTLSVFHWSETERFIAFAALFSVGSVLTATGFIFDELMSKLDAIVHARSRRSFEEEEKWWTQYIHNKDAVTEIEEKRKGIQ